MAKKSEITIQTFALADQIITAEDKKNSIIGIFDKIFVRDLPAKHSQMAIMITILGEAGKKDAIEVSIVRPSGQVEFTQSLEFTFGLNSKANLVMNLEGFPIHEVGTHAVLITHNDREISKYEFDVLRMKGQDGQSKVIN